MPSSRLFHLLSSTPDTYITTFCYCETNWLSLSRQADSSDAEDQVRPGVSFIWKIITAVLEDPYNASLKSKGVLDTLLAQRSWLPKYFCLPIDILENLVNWLSLLILDIQTRRFSDQDFLQMQRSPGRNGCSSDFMESV